MGRVYQNDRGNYRPDKNLVETLLDRLAPPMRAMLVLRELEGLEYEEIAQVLHIPVGRLITIQAPEPYGILRQLVP